MSEVPINSAKAAEINAPFSATKALNQCSLLQEVQPVIFKDNYSWNPTQNCFKYS